MTASAHAPSPSEPPLAALVRHLAHDAPGATVAALAVVHAPDGPCCSAVVLSPGAAPRVACRLSLLDNAPWPLPAHPSQRATHDFPPTFVRSLALGDEDFVALAIDDGVLLGALVVSLPSPSPAALAALDRRLPAALDELRSVAAAAAARWDDAQHAAFLVLGADEFSHETAVAHAWLDDDRRARLVRHLSDPTLAAFALDDAWVTVERLTPVAPSGAPHLADRAIRLVSVQRLAPPSLPRAALLTPRQREICDYAASGATVDEIARTLGRSANTVKHHLKLAYDVLGVASRLELSAVLDHSRAATAPLAAVGT